MVAQALNFIFWGYLLIFLRIDIVVDLLPDPLGYLFIAIGCFKLQDKFPIAQQAGILSVIMIFISAPTFFINVHETTDQGWGIYALVLMTLNLIMIYFTFSILKDIVKKISDKMIEQTQLIFTLYISTHLIQLAFLSFSMNIPENISIPIAFILMLITLIMTIVFLVLIRSIRKASLI